MIRDDDFGSMGDVDSVYDDQSQPQQQQNQVQPQDRQQREAEVHYGDGISDVDDAFDDYCFSPGQQPSHDNIPFAEWGISSVDAQEGPADQVRHQQVMGVINDKSMSEAIDCVSPNPNALVTPADLSLGGRGMNTQIERGLIQERLREHGITAPQFPPYATPPGKFALTEQEIISSGPGVQIGSTRFPNLASALADTSTSELPDPGTNGAVFDTARSSRKHSMVDRHPYYDDSEEKRFWMESVINARNRMWIISRQEPQNMDLQRPDETKAQAKRRRGKAINESKAEDEKHKCRLDPKHRDYDARYAQLWRAQQDRISTHNAAQRATWLASRREFDQRNDLPDVPDLTEPDEGGDDLYDFSFYLLPFRTLKGRPAAARQVEQAKASENYDFAPTTERCLMCLKYRKSCDLQETGFPCTRCADNNYLCEDGDSQEVNTNAGETVSRGRASANRRVNAGASTSSMSAVSDREARARKREAIRASASGKTAAPASGKSARGSRRGREKQQRDTRASTAGMSVAPTSGTSTRRRGRDSPPARDRSASPERETHSDKCDNCKKYGTFCEDTRPCRQCSDKGLVCEGTYQGKPYRDPNEDEADPSGSGGGGNGSGNGGFQIEDLFASECGPTVGPGITNLDSIFAAHSSVLDGASDSGASVAQPERSIAYRPRGAMISSSVATEAFPLRFNGSSTGDNVVQLPSQRRLVNPNTGVELPFRPGQAFPTAATVLVTSMEQAEDTRKLVLQTAQRLATAAELCVLTDQETVMKEISSLRETADEDEDIDLNRLH